MATPSPDRPKMYWDLADWFHLVTSPEEYAVEADFYAGALIDAALIPVRSILELGSGGGNNASHLRDRFELTLVDLSEGMLELSKTINPGCEHVRGDMRTLRLDRTFDAVFLHDAVMYMATEEDLRAAITTAFVHCKPGGAALFAPDCVAETLAPMTDHGGHDGKDRSLRYLEWIWDPDPEDETYIADYAYMLRDEYGNARVEFDRHTCGVFSREKWLRLIEQAGFRAERREGVPDETGLDLFVGVKET